MTNREAEDDEALRFCKMRMMQGRDSAWRGMMSCEDKMRRKQDED